MTARPQLNGQHLDATVGQPAAPHDVDAEAALLGLCLEHPMQIERARTVLTGVEFYRPQHETLWRLLCRQADAGLPTDVVTIAPLAAADLELGRAIRTKPLWLHDLWSTGQAANPDVTTYAKTVHTLHRRRTLGVQMRRQLQKLEAPDADLDQLELGYLQILEDAVRNLEQKGNGAVAGGWRPVDLAPVLDGTYNRPTPTVGARADGAGMFYPGRTHTVVSESEGGKTWCALAQARVELERGNAVVFLDFEDSAGGVVGRLLLLGADPAAVRDRFAYIAPETPIAGLGNHHDLEQVLGDLRPSLVVLDGVTEAMTMHGLNPLDNKDCATFGRLVPRWIADRGPAMTSLDHVTKDREGRGRYAIGAVHKLNALSGAAFTLENRTPFGVGLTGRSGVYISKDRPGELRRRALPSGERRYWWADLVLASEHADLLEATLAVPAERAADFRPTVLMGRIAAALEEHGPLAQRRIVIAVTGKTHSIVNALGYLILDGYVSESTPHKLLKPYAVESAKP